MKRMGQVRCTLLHYGGFQVFLCLRAGQVTPKC